MAFSVGDIVEVSSKQEGFFGSYFEAKVIAKLHSTKSYVVEYKNLVEEDWSEPLREVVPAKEVRPSPPEFPVINFKLGDWVDAFDNDGWWVGKISGMNVDEGKYFVYFDYFNVGIFYDVGLIRMHQEWKNGKWCLRSRNY
ncbi:hypothetical protein RD792_006343 [Penstemon davidsonii]|uniref:Agenet domain-containing protein n=1 Tax=Penstemon davidsonii TaxID=160366 RepID=A0ABR0DE58_9LAMI|nr:hypothetical protein RD792_006343 [Penstemon davidsonii]